MNSQKSVNGFKLAFHPFILWIKQDIFCHHSRIPLRQMLNLKLRPRLRVVNRYIPHRNVFADTVAIVPAGDLADGLFTYQDTMALAGDAAAGEAQAAPCAACRPSCCPSAARACRKLSAAWKTQPCP